MKVGLFSYAFPHPNRGYNPGIETVVYNLAKALAKEVDVTVYASFVNGGEKVERMQGFDILRAKSFRSGLFSLNQFSFCRNLVREYRDHIKEEDILHDVGSLIPFWFKSFDSPSITTFYHYESLKTINGYLSAFPCPLIIRKEKNADKIVAISNFSKDQLLQRFSIKEDKIEVIPTGVDDSIFNPFVAPKLEYENVLLFVGPLVQRKGVKHLIHALPIIKKEIKDVRVIIIGKGPEKKNLVKLSEELDLEKNINFIENVSKEDLPRYYSTASLFVFPTFLEGFGMVAIESMACGTPVVASDIEPLKSIIGDSGMFFNPGNHLDLAEKVIEILNDKYLRNSLSENAAKRATNYTWNNISTQYLDLYQKLLEEK